MRLKGGNRNLPSGTTNLGKSELDTPDLTLVAQTVLSDELQLGITTFGVGKKKAIYVSLDISHNRLKQSQAPAQWPVILTVGRPRRDDGGPLRSWSKTTAPCWNYDEDDNGGIGEVVFGSCGGGGLLLLLGRVSKERERKESGSCREAKKSRKFDKQKNLWSKVTGIECELKVGPDSKRKKNCGWDRAREGLILSWVSVSRLCGS